MVIVLGFCFCWMYIFFRLGKGGHENRWVHHGMSSLAFRLVR